jgi:hypothetical protein
MYILSCEPATCAIPEWHKELFRGYEEVVTSTEGWAPGSLNLAQAFATKLRTLLAHGDLTRLLIDFSKRPGDPERFSRFSAKLTDDHKRRLDERHHLAHIKLLKHRIEEEIRKEGKAIHLSFRTDHRPDMSTVELVQDISRDLETGLVRRWAEALRSAAPELRFAVVTDPTYGLSAELREHFPENFGSVSVIANQTSFLEGKPMRWDQLRRLLLDTLPPP